MNKGEKAYNSLLSRYEKKLTELRNFKKKLNDFENRTCESCKHFKLDYFEPNRGTCRNKNVPTTGYMVDCDYGCNKYEPKENK